MYIEKHCRGDFAEYIFFLSPCILTNIYYGNTMSGRMFGMGSLRNCGSSSRVRDTRIYFIVGGKAKNLYLCLMRCGRVGSIGDASFQSIR